MCVVEHGAAYALVTDDGANACECYVEPHWFGKLWREEAELNLTRTAGLCR